MAQKAIEIGKVEEMAAVYARTRSLAETARICGVGISTVGRYVNHGDPARGIPPFARAAQMPIPVPEEPKAPIDDPDEMEPPEPAPMQAKTVAERIRDVMAVSNAEYHQTEKNVLTIYNQRLKRAAVMLMEPEPKRPEGDASNQFELERLKLWNHEHRRWDERQRFALQLVGVGDVLALHRIRLANTASDPAEGAKTELERLTDDDLEAELNRLDKRATRGQA